MSAVVAVRVDSGVSSVGNAAVVRAVGTLGGRRVIVVTGDGLLDFVDDARHVG